MADSKITALTALTAADPTVDMFPVVDVSDTTMAASGTTKRISINNILACSPSATLSSATITGDLTVDTSTLKVDSANNRVGIGTASPAETLHVSGGNIRMSINQFLYLYYGSATNYASLGADNSGNVQVFTGLTSPANRFQIANDGVCTWSNVGGVAGTAMTLNSAGLGVGTSPSYNIDVLGATLPTISVRSTLAGASNARLYLECAGTNSGHITYNRSLQAIQLGANGGTTGQVTLDSIGNVGIGVTPSAGGSGYYKTLELGKAGCGLFVGTASLTGSELSYFVGNAVLYYNAGNTWKYGNNGAAAIYGIEDGIHKWYNATTGTAGVDFTPTQAMTLDASGNLLVRCTTAGSEQLGVQVIGYTNGNYVRINHNASAASGDSYLNFFFNAAQIGSITQNGTTGVLYNINSDYRLKESVQPLVGGLARVNALKPSVYKWKSDGSNGEGFLAHELAEVVPFAVSGEKDAINEDGSIKSQGIDMSRVVPILVAAIQELAAEVNALKNA